MTDTIELLKQILELKPLSVNITFVHELVAAEDYCADVGLLRSPSRLEMLYARQKVVAYAKAYDLQAIDLVMPY
jgi:citrate lyase subunit beta-like protein